MRTMLAIAAVLFLGTSAAEAATITMGTYNGPTPPAHGLGRTTYTESGFDFFTPNPHTFLRLRNGGPDDSDPTPSTALTTDISTAMVKISRADGRAFTLTSMDIDDFARDTVTSETLNYTYTLAGGGSGSGSFLLPAVLGYTNIVLNLTQLKSFTFDAPSLQFDNVVAAATPLPSTLLFMLTALAGLIPLARSRSRQHT